MGRSRAAPSSSRGSSFHAPPPPTRTAAPAGGSHHQQQQQQSHQQSHAQPQAPPPQVTNVYVQRGGMGGGGGMGFMGTVASVAAGSVAGHAISNMLFSRDHPPAEPAQAQAVAQQYGEGACGPQIKGYAKCMEVNAQNAQACNWAWDMFMQCQEQKGTGTA